MRTATHIGLRGYPAVETIERVGADNQTDPAVLEQTYGSVVDGNGW
jgi:hypothetical protein